MRRLFTLTVIIYCSTLHIYGQNKCDFRAGDVYMTIVKRELDLKYNEYYTDTLAKDTLINKMKIDEYIRNIFLPLPLYLPTICDLKKIYFDTTFNLNVYPLKVENLKKNSKNKSLSLSLADSTTTQWIVDYFVYRKKRTKIILINKYPETIELYYLNGILQRVKMFDNIQIGCLYGPTMKFEYSIIYRK